MFSSVKRRCGFPILVLLVLAPLLSARGSAEPLTPAMQAELGAATWIPADAGYFAASYRLRERWQAFTETRAYQEILTMPAVQMGLGWLQQQPYLGQLAAMRAQNPLLDDGVEVLQDAFSQEVFVYVDARGPGFINELGGLYNSLTLNGFLEGINESTGALPGYTESKRKSQILREVVAVEQHLRMPGVVFGFRLSNPQAGRDLLAGLKPLLQQTLPLPVQEESLGEGEFLTVSVSAAMFLTPEVEADMGAEFGLADVDAETAEQFVQFVRSQTLSIGLGMRDEYLLVSLGADNTHLANLGTGISLAESDALAPLRRHFLSRLIGLSYVHPQLTRYGKMDVEGLVANLDELLRQAKDHLPAGLHERVEADATQLLSEVNESLPEARPKVAASFWQDGIESFSFSAMVPGTMDSSKPLSILAHAGESPLLAVAAHAPPSSESYNRLVHWIKTFYGYFEDYAVPQIPAEDRAEFEQFEALALPAFQQLYETTRDLLIPSLDGGQSLFVLDSGGVFNRSPDTKELLSQPIRFPRLAIVTEVNDAEKFATAWAQYRDTFNSVMTKVAELKPDVSQVRLPPPASRRLGDATLYTYQILSEYNLASYLNNDFEPHALLSSTHLVVSLSSQHSAKLLAASPVPEPSKVDFNQPAGRVLWFDFLALKDLICDDVEAILALVEQEQEIDANLSILIKLHVDKLRKALGGVQNYSSRTYEEEGLSVTHSWFHLQDIE